MGIGTGKSNRPSKGLRHHRWLAAAASAVCLASVGILSAASAPAGAVPPPSPLGPIGQVLQLLPTTTNVLVAGGNLYAEDPTNPPPAFLVNSPVNAIATVTGLGAVLGLGGGSVTFSALTPDSPFAVAIGTAPVSCNIHGCVAQASTVTLPQGPWVISATYTPANLLVKGSSAVSSSFSIVGFDTELLRMSQVRGCGEADFTLQTTPVIATTQGDETLTFVYNTPSGAPYGPVVINNVQNGTFPIPNPNGPAGDFPPGTSIDVFQLYESNFWENNNGDDSGLSIVSCA